MQKTIPKNVQLIEGVIEIKLQKADSGWTICTIDGQKATGVIGPMIKTGDFVKATGVFEKHPRFGEQMKLSSCFVALPATTMNVRSYLEHNFNYIGNKVSKEIIDQFGDRFLQLVETDPESLHGKIKGLTPERIQKIQDHWLKIKNGYEADLFFEQAGFSANMIRRIYKAYLNPTEFELYNDLSDVPISIRMDIIGKIKDNPYDLIEKVELVGFKKADQIAMSEAVGYDRKSPKRIQAGILHALRDASMEGHCCLPSSDLFTIADKILGNNDVIQIAMELEALVAGNRLSRVGEGTELERIYLPAYNMMEIRTAKKLRQFCLASHSSQKVDYEKIPNWDKLTVQQKEAVKTSTTSKIMVLTGPPGTGKTFALKAILQALDQTGEDYMLAAPTGKAAKRMTELTGVKAQTIHRLLKFSPQFGWLHNEKNPLPCGNLILDESSMMSLSLVYRVMQALDSNSRLILVGDIDQLPSVESGQVFRDIIESGTIPVVRLDVIMRQDETSPIVRNAWLINHGMQLQEDNEQSFFCHYHDDDEEIEKDIYQKIEWLIKEKGLNLDDIQVLAPMKKSIIGTKALNLKLSEKFNPSGKTIIGTDFRTYDRVIQIKNNYKRLLFDKSYWASRSAIAKSSIDVIDKKYSMYQEGCFNGEIGKIIDFDENERIFYVDFDDGFTCYSISQSNEELKLSFALTCHKSQGSEYKAVVIPLHTCMYIMLQRNLFYTAITRARKFVVLCASYKAVQLAISRADSKQRFTGLKLRIQGYLLDESEQSVQISEDVFDFNNDYREEF